MDRERVEKRMRCVQGQKEEKASNMRRDYKVFLPFSSETHFEPQNILLKETADSRHGKGMAPFGVPFETREEGFPYSLHV